MLAALLVIATNVSPSLLASSNEDSKTAASHARPFRRRSAPIQAYPDRIADTKE